MSVDFVSYFSATIRHKELDETVFYFLQKQLTWFSLVSALWALFGLDVIKMNKQINK